MRYLSAALLVVVLVCASAVDASLVPGVYNEDFEKQTEGWGWSINNGCQVSYKVEADNPHSGKTCISFSDQTGYVTNVYGRFNQIVPVFPETEYELSLWVRGEDVKSDNDTIHFTDWGSYRLDLPAGTFGWQKVKTRFRTNPGQTSLNLGINVVNSCKTLAVDDVVLTPIGAELKAEGIDGSLIAPTKLIGHDYPAFARALVSSELKGARYELTVSGSGKDLLDKKGEIKPGDNAIEYAWTTGKVPYGVLDVTVQVLDSQGKVLAQATQKVNKVQSKYDPDMVKVEKRFNTEFLPLYKQCKTKKIPLDYPTVTKTTLEQFIPIIRTDMQKEQNWRVEFAIKDFNRSLDQSIADMKAYLADPKIAPNAIRYKTGKLEIKDYHFEGTRIDSKGNVDRGPLFFSGYGHFAQLRRDMNRWPGYGVNIIQSSEFGPAQVLTGENEVNLDLAKEVAKSFDDAAKNNVKVDFLVCPHYFPEWALNKWPKLRNGGGGFFGFVPDEPEAKQVIEKFLRIVIPMIKDKPALNSICLSNEPVLIDTARATNTRPMWNAYLAKTHGSIEALNKLYGTSYKSFDEVTVGEGDKNDPRFYDWCSFNNERFAGWHKWEADVIHEMAPDVPVHAKVMSIWLNRDMVAWGCDPELFGEMGQLNGNDCYYQGGAGPGWSAPWQFMCISYDLQRSAAKKPIFNSENHLTPDCSQAYVAPEHYKAALWQGAIHGQGCTTIWAWEHVYAPGYCLYGLVMDRPGCAEAVGKTNLDLNRFAEEVAAVQDAKSPVAILYSITSEAKDSNYAGAVDQIYPALSFHGFKVDFITEKQLQAGKGKDYKMIFFPEAGHVQNATFEAVKNLPESVKLVLFGDCLSHDPYGNAFATDAVAAIRSRALFFDAKPVGWKLWPRMREELAKVNALPEVQVVDAITGEPVWGLEWLPAKIGNRTVISIVNLRDKQANVKILVNGKRVEAKNLLSLGGLESVRVIAPMNPVLAEVK